MELLNPDIVKPQKSVIEKPVIKRGRKPKPKPIYTIKIDHRAPGEEEIEVCFI